MSYDVSGGIATVPQKKRAAAYVRIGTMADMSCLENLSAQISRYSAKIQANSEWEYAGVYADDTTGTKDIRFEFERMLADARAGGIDIILTDSISRFGQTATIMLETVGQLQSLGIAVLFEDQGINTLSGSGEQILSLLAECADRERLAFSEYMKSRRREAFARGEGGLYPTYGYNLINRTLVPDEKQAKIVRRIFEDYLSGKSPKVIMSELNDEGVASAKGAGWTSKTISRMLTNERYAGHCLLQKTFTVDPKTGKVAVNRGELPMFFVENSHHAIISQEIFDRAQKMVRVRCSLFGLTPDFVESGALLMEDEAERLNVLANSNLGLHKIYGYDYANGVLTPNRKQAKIVRQLFNEYNMGISPYAIADNLERRHVPSMFGGKWTAATVSKTLMNVRYAGHRLVQRRMSSTGEVITQFMMNTHRPIVSQEIFDKAQEMRKLRRDVFNAKDSNLFANVAGELCGIFGFDYVGGAFIPNRAETEVVRRIFDSYNSGDSIATIVGELNNDNIFMAHGGKWHKRAVTNVLTNQVYSHIVGENVMVGANQMAVIRKIVYARNECDKCLGTPQLKETAKAFERGKTGLRPVFGFDYFNLGISVNDEKAQIIKTVYHDYNQGISPLKIAEKLNEAGISTIHDELWNKNFVDKLLTNEIYIKIVGKCIFDKAQKTRSTRKDMFNMKDGNKDNVEISEIIRKTIRKSFSMGKGALRPLYGYFYVDKILIPNEEQAKTVRHIFDEYTAGVGPTRIAAQLNNEGVPTMTGAKWYQATVQKLLENERYAGHCRVQKSVTDELGKRTVNRGGEVSYMFENTHPAIVPQDVFDRAQEIFRTHNPRKGTDNVKGKDNSGKDSHNF